MNLLEIRALRKNYGPVAALAGIDLDVAEGSRTAIVGPSGSGKTTPLRCADPEQCPERPLSWAASASISPWPFLPKPSEGRLP